MTEPLAPSETQTVLHTLGRLELSGTSFRQTRSLLLLTYLALEGPRPRRFLAELLWPGATDPLNSLAVSLSKLRRLGVLGADDLRAWATVVCDVQELQASLLKGEVSKAAEHYSGAFLEGMASESGAEYEEWALGWRETLASQVRSALIEQAEGTAGRGQFDEAAQQAERAVSLPGAGALESGDLIRVSTLLVAAQHPAREALERECQDLGVLLPSSPEAARGQLRRTQIGRSRELERLLGLGLGEWAWVRGGAGMGKTSLLRELASKSGWQFVSARSGLPYATLEALTTHLEGGEDAVLRRLLQAKQNFILDDWHQADPESQRLLIRLRALQPACRVVLAGPEEPPVQVGTWIDLAPLTAEELTPFPGAYEATDGVPALVGAWLRGEPLASALENRLRGLPEPSRRVYLALVLMEDADLTLVRQALSLDASQTSEAVSLLLAAGLIQGSGRPYGREAAQAHVRAHPTELATLSLSLARCLPDVQALPLYQQGKVMWETADLPNIRQAYLTFARAALRRGFPARATALLREAPPGPDITLLLGQALERTGEYKEAMATVRDLPESGGLLALRSSLFWRLGQPEDARLAAEQALDGSDESRAEALTTLGSLALSQGRYAEAEAHYRRATVLWSSLGEEERRVRALNNQALARFELGEDAQVAFQEILAVAADYPTIQALALLNLGFAYLRDKQFAAAERVYREAVVIAEEFGATALLVNVLTNLGALLHEQGQLVEARQTYERGLVLARQSGEQMFIAMLLTNLAELTEDRESLEEAMRLLKAGGHQALLAHAESIYARFMPVSGGKAQH